MPTSIDTEVRGKDLIDLRFSPLSGTRQIVTTDPTHLSDGLLRSLSNHFSVDRLVTGDSHWPCNTALQLSVSQGTDKLRCSDMNGMSD